jgi:hypothetical protein
MKPSSNAALITEKAIRKIHEVWCILTRKLTPQVFPYLFS